MSSVSPKAAGIRIGHRFELTFAAITVLLVALTAAVILSPRVSAALVSYRLDVAVTTLATIVAAAVALLAWGEHRENRDTASLYRASAFGVLATLNAMIVAAMLLGAAGVFGLALDEPGQLPLLVHVVARGFSALLLVAGGLVAAGYRAWPGTRHPWSLFVGPALLLVVLTAIGAAVQPMLPTLLDPADAALLRERPDQPLLIGAGLEALASVQILVGIAFGVAGWLSYLAYRARGAVSESYLAIGLLIAAFSQLHAAIHPGVYASLVTTADLLRVAFYTALLLGIAAQRRQDLRDLRRANVELRRLREAELAEAMYEERARLAREIHDGLAQDLWYAKLKQARLADLATASGEARELVREVADAIDTSLAEARQAVMALRPSESGGLGNVLTRYAEDFGDRFGIRTECLVDRDLEVSSPRAQAELLRIVQEALNNVRKHADATLVRIEARHDAGSVVLRVIDNGRGFDPELVSTSGYGLRSMSERANLVGARLRIDTQPQGGTRVEVLVPGTGGRG